MSTKIDEKVVEMKFDNKQFESGVKTSLSTLDKLKQSLNFKDLDKSFSSISSAAKNVNMDSLGGAIETVKTKFSALEVMAVTALANITNSAVNAGKRLIAALTIDPVKSGFQEYELKMGSIQTIMAGTGESLETVNRYLDELNTYSDKTIYSFADMTSNIGKFTNAGVKLEDAVMAIKGISNEAAVSGANANEASRAMYNFSQALSAGYVKLIDWKSIENANMATVEFKTNLLESAVACGTLTKTTDGLYSTGKKTISATKDFNESLQEQWMTTDVLVNTLRDYADENTAIGKKAYASAQDVKTFTMMIDTLKEALQSGWAQSWQILVGDFNEAKSLFTDASKFFGDIIGKAADARNSFLSEVFSKKTVTEKDWAGLVTAGSGIKTFKEIVIQTAKEHNIAIDDMIKSEGSFAKTLKSGWFTSDIMTDVMKKVSNASKESAKATGDMTKKLTEFQNVVDRVWKGEFGNTEKRVKAITDAGYKYEEVQKLVNLTLNKRKLTLEDLSETELKSIGYTDKEISKLKELAQQAKETGTPLNELINALYRKSGRELVIESLKNALEGLSSVIGVVKEAWGEVFGKPDTDQLYGVLEGINKLSKSLKPTKEGLEKIKNASKGLFTILNIGVGIAKTVVGLGLKLVGVVLKPLLNNLLTLAGVMGNVVSSFVNFGERGIGFVTKKMTELYNEFMKSEFVVSATDKMNKAFQFFSDVISYLKVKMGGLNFGTLEENIASLQSYAIKAFDKIGESAKKVFDTLKNNKYIGPVIDKITVALSKLKTTFTGFKLPSFADFTKSFESLFNYLKNGNYMSNAITMIAGTIVYLKNALYESVPPIADSVIGKISDWAENSVDFVKKIVNVLKKIPEVAKQAAHYIGIAITALKGLIEGFMGPLTLSNILDISKSIAAVAVLIQLYRALANFAEMPGRVNDVLKEIAQSFDALQTTLKAKAMKEFAIAVGILVASIVVLSFVPWEKAWKAALAVVAIVGVLAIVQAKLSKVSAQFGNLNMLGFAASVLGLSVGVLLLVTALKKLSGVNWEESLDGLKIMGSLLAGLTIASMALTKVKAQITTSAITILVLVKALEKLIPVLKAYADLAEDYDRIMKGLQLLGYVALGLTAFIAVAGLTTKGSGMLGAAAAMIAFVAAVKILEDIPIDTLKGIAIGISILMVALGVALRLMGSVSSMVAAGSLALLAVDILAIAAAIYIMGQVPFESLIAGFSGLIITLSASAIIVGVLSGVFQNLALGVGLLIGVLVAVALVIISVGASARLFAESIAMIGTALPSVTDGLLYMITRLTHAKELLYEFAKIATVVSLPLAAFGVALVAIGVGVSFISMGMVAIAAAATIFVGAIGLAGKALDALGTGIKSFIKKVADSRPDIKNFIMVFTKFTDAMVEQIPKISGLLALLGLALVVVGAGIIVVAAGVLVLAAAILVAGVGALLFAGAFALVSAILDTASDGLVHFGQAICEFMTLVGGKKDTIENFQITLEAFATSMKGLAVAATISLVILAGGLTAVGLSLIVVSAGVLVLAVALLVAGLGGLAFAGAFAIIVACLETASVGLTLFGTAIKQFITTIAEAHGSLEAFSNVTNTLGSSIFVMLTKIGAGTLVMASGVIILASGLAALSITMGLNATMTALLTGAVTLLASALDKLGSGFRVAATGLERFGVAFTFTLNRILSGLDRIVEKFESAGANIVAGFVRGIFSGISQAIASAAAMGTIFYETFCKIMGIQSPSTVMESAGGFSVLGFVKGIGENLGLVKGSSTTMAETAYDPISQLPSLFGQSGTAASTSFASSLTNGMGGISAENLVPNMTQLTGLYANQASIDGETYNRTIDSVMSATNPKTPGAIANNGALCGLQGVSDGTNYMAGMESMMQQYGIQMPAGIDNLDSLYTAAGTSDAGVYNTALDSGIGSSNAMTNAMNTMVQRTTESQPRFTQAGTDIMTAFITGVTNEEPNLMIAMSTMMSNAITSITSQNELITTSFGTILSNLTLVITNKTVEFNTAGQNIMTSIITGINIKKETLNILFRTFLDALILIINNKQPAFTLAAQTLMIKFTAGLRSQDGPIIQTVSNTASAAASAINNKQQEFYNAGANCARGFANGIKDNAGAAIDAAVSMAAAAVSAAKKRLDEHSPSRVTYGIGAYFGQGFVNGITSFKNKSAAAGVVMAESAKTGLSNAISKIADFIESDMDTQPVIRPVLDLSNIQSGAGQLDALFSRTQAMSISSGMNPSYDQSTNGQNGANVTKANAFNFVQNNYSPKALSRTEIYRQTKNQFATLKGVVDET